MLIHVLYSGRYMYTDVPWGIHLLSVLQNVLTKGLVHTNDGRDRSGIRIRVRTRRIIILTESESIRWKQKRKPCFHITKFKMVEGLHVFFSKSCVKGLEMSYMYYVIAWLINSSICCYDSNLSVHT